MIKDMKHILSAKQFNKSQIEEILREAEKMERQCAAGKIEKVLRDKIVACMFFEPSTRTRLSFETAALKLGAGVISAENAMENSSAHKGETIEDTARIVCNYADILVMRHPKEGMPERAAAVASKPVINAGDGGNQHPTQSLLDLYTIKRHTGRLDNLKIAFGFDPKHSRTIRSLAVLLTHFSNNSFTFICPPSLNPTADLCQELKDRDAAYQILDSLESFNSYDVFYANRLQEERFQHREDFEKYRKTLVITKFLVKDSKTIIMDPLPRIDEIENDVDKLSNAVYFQQAQNGLYIRMALLKMVLES